MHASNWKKEPQKVLSTWRLNDSNPIHVTDLFLYPLKTSGKVWFSDLFQGV